MENIHRSLLTKRNFTIKISLIIIFLSIGLLSESKSPLYTSLKKVEAHAKTEYGRTVILFSDGTWEYWELQKKQTQPQKSSPPNHKY